MTDIKDLIKVAEGSIEGAKTKVSKSDQEIRKFIAELHITSCDSLVPKALVYDYYTQWAKRNSMSSKAFYRYFNKYIQSKRVIGVFCYLVDPTCFKLPEFYNVYKDPRFNLRKARKMRDMKYKGVSMIAGYYIARLQTEEGLHFLGRFKKAKDAARAYDLAAYEHFGNEADLNNPRNIREYGKKTKEKRAPIR